MPAMNLKSMDVEALLSLRADIDKKLGQKRSELEQQLLAWALKVRAMLEPRAAGVPVAVPR